MCDVKIKQAVNILREGGLVAFPTETVYGLGADARQASAVSKIFKVKERPHDHPLIVHLSRFEELPDWAQEISEEAILLAKTYWPGPLTIILKKQPHVLSTVTANQDTVGLRMPNHPVALSLLQAFGSGIAAPSANKFTHLSPTTANAVYAELGDAVDLILDGGVCKVGLESTIIDMSGPHPVILRPGMISAKSISNLLKTNVLLHRKDKPTEMTETRVPGMHHLHYAPITKTILINTEHLADFLLRLTKNDLPSAILTYSSNLSLASFNQIEQISMSSDPVNYAHDLYHTLRLLDACHYKQIIIEAVPSNPPWEAIHDRLVKATGART